MRGVKDIIMPDGSVHKVANLKRRIRKYQERIRHLEKLIDDSGYDKPVECLSCGWKGFESELDQNCICCDDCGWSDGHDGCPACKSLYWEFTDI